MNESPRIGAGRRLRWAALPVMTLALLGLASPAVADVAVTEGEMTLSVSQAENLPLTGGVITVSGSGYDETKGIYVAVCVDNGPGELPTPCIGGADMSGEGGGSGWISSNPPSYAEGLTTPFGPGGTFEVTMNLTAVDPIGGTDCTQVSCAVVTRADHTRTQDRSLDVRVPLVFSATGVIEPSAPVEPSASAEPSESVVPEPSTSSASESTPEPSSPISSPTSAAAESSETGPTAESSTSEPMMSIMAPVETSSVEPAAAEVESSSGWVWWVIGGVVLLVVIGGFVLARRRGKTADHE